MGCRPENRIQGINLYDDIPAFFCLFAVLLLLFSTTTLSYPDDESMEKHVKSEISSPSGRRRSSDQSKDVVHFYQLYNLCSRHHVSVKQRRIQARAKMGSHYAWLRIEPVTFGGRIRIRSNTSHYYLCFNSNGSLTVKLSAEGRSSCTFIEQFTANNNIEFQSEVNPNWRIGFNKEGHRVAGNQWKRTHRSHISRECFQFVRTGWKKQTPNGTIDLEPPQGATPGGNGDIVGELVTQLQRNDRRRLQNTKRRKPK